LDFGQCNRGMLICQSRLYHSTRILLDGGSSSAAKTQQDQAKAIATCIADKERAIRDDWKQETRALRKASLDQEKIASQRTDRILANCSDRLDKSTAAFAEKIDRLRNLALGIFVFVTGSVAFCVKNFLDKSFR